METMNFARKQLEKYGWKEGQGLGRDENGITAAVRPKLKFDAAGIGHQDSENHNWWDHLYNKAASNINVKTAENGSVQLNVSDPDGVEIITKEYSVKKFGNNLEYGKFIKTSKLTENGTVDFDNNNETMVKRQLNNPVKFPLSEEEVFARCNGRTAHKGARHGLCMTGKLERIDKQEKLLMKKLEKVSLNDNDCYISKRSLEKKLKKLKEHKNKQKLNHLQEDNAVLSSTSQDMMVTSPFKSKNRRRERKRVSFSETVTEYQTQEQDPNASDNAAQDADITSSSDGNSQPSIPITVVHSKKIKDNDDSRVVQNICLPVPDQDEGIDCSDFTPTKEKSTTGLQSKIKEENRDMKRKLKKLRKKCTFAQSEIKVHKGSKFMSSVSSYSAQCTKCCKRKIILEEDRDVDMSAKKRYVAHPKVSDFDEIDIDVADCSDSSRSKKCKKEKRCKKDGRMDIRIDNVAESLNQICKISESNTKK